MHHQTKENLLKKYSTVIKHHIQCIVQSGLLLDEDMDIISTNYNPSDVDVQQQRLTTLQKVLGACSLASTLVMLRKRYSYYLAVALVSPLITIGLKYTREVHHQRQRIQDLKIAVAYIRDISKLNRMMLEYFRVRRIVNPDTATVVNPFTRGMRKLIDSVSDEEVTVLYKFRIFIRQFGSYVPSLNNAYAHLEDLEFSDYFSSDVSTINDGYLYLQKICDVYVLLASNCMTCLALVLCPSQWSEYDVDVDVDEVMNKVVPRLKTMAVKCYNEINRKFDDVKYYFLNRSHGRNNFKKPKPSTADRLQTSAYNTIIYTTEILQKSKIIYDKLQEVDMQDLAEREKLGHCLYDLRCQVFDYYECLDGLHKIFQVNINTSKGKAPASHLQVPILTSDDSEVVADASLNPVEPSDDEEYELYVGAIDTPSEGPSDIWIEENRRLASQLGQELKQKLKNHAQFIAARKKRGIIDEEPERGSQVSDDEKPPLVTLPGPSADLMAREGRSNAGPPPPPPPLPPIELAPFKQDSPCTVDHFLEAIKVVSKTRNNVEEVFGDSSEDDD